MTSELVCIIFDMCNTGTGKSHVNNGKFVAVKYRVTKKLGDYKSWQNIDHFFKLMNIHC